MPTVAEVPVFWRDQDRVREKPHTTWTRIECRAKKNISGQFCDHGRSFMLFAPRPKIYPVSAADLLSSNILPDASTISNEELLANVGIAGPSGMREPAPRHLVRRAQQKIRAYPRVHDELAVVGHGRWYDSSVIQVTVVQ